MTYGNYLIAARFQISRRYAYTLASIWQHRLKDTRRDGIGR